MRLALLTSLTMIAFAANSVLTRLAIEGQHIDPSGFAIVRVASGALVLGMVITLRGGGLPLLRRNRLPGAFSLAAYMIGFSLAYLTLDAGLGALILFGVVQITMFLHGALRGTAPNMRQITGAAIAFAGLLVALWPGAGNSSDLAGATAANFLLCLPILLVLLASTGLYFSPTGLALGILCGGLTSGLGYALWYNVLPGFDSATAAVVQLSVPVIAIGAGVVFLGESLSLLLIIATFLVLGGIGWAISAQSVPADRS